MPNYLGPPFTAAGSGKKKDKQIPRKYVEMVSEEVQEVAQQQGVYTIVMDYMKVQIMNRVVWYVYTSHNAHIEP